MSTFFKPYEGSRPFLFISYAHKQSDAVVSTIRILHEKGWRLWYDEGIPAGSDWPANIASHMKNCERVLFFLSVRALESPNCYSEMKTAARLGKPVLIIRLENAVPDEKWKGILDGRPEIPLLESAAERAEAILNSSFLTRRFHISWAERIPWRVLGFAASLLIFLASAAALGTLLPGRMDPAPEPEPIAAAPTPTAVPSPTPVPVLELGGAERFFAIRFPDRQQERAIRHVLGNSSDEVYRWQIAEITDLYFCGNMTPDSLENVRFSTDGTCRINDVPVIRGEVSDLSLIKSMVKLEQLALICQPLGDLSGLSGHLFLRELSLSGSSVDNLTKMKELPCLEVLHLEHTKVRDLSALDRFPNLNNVTVSRDMLPLEWNEDAAFSVVLAKES